MSIAYVKMESSKVRLLAAEALVRINTLRENSLKSYDERVAKNKSNIFFAVDYGQQNRMRFDLIDAYKNMDKEIESITNLSNIEPYVYLSVEAVSLLLGK